MACEEQPKNLGWVSKLLALWIAIAIVIGLALGKFFPQFRATLQIGIPIGLFFMICPAMTKIEIGELKESDKKAQNKLR
jgi:arsenite transporter